jgi:hypothetical protein
MCSLNVCSFLNAFAYDFTFCLVYKSVGLLESYVELRPIVN